MDYQVDKMPFALAGKALVDTVREDWRLFPLELFPGLPLYGVEQFVICPLVDTVFVPYDLGLKLWKGHVCATKGLRVVLSDARGRPVPGCEIGVTAAPRAGRRIVYDGKACPRGRYLATVTTDGNGEALIPIDMGTCVQVALGGQARTTAGMEDFRAQAEPGLYWGPDGLHKWEDAGEGNRIVLNLKGIYEPPEETPEPEEGEEAQETAEAAAKPDKLPVPKSVRAAVVPVEKGRCEARSARGGASPAGLGMDTNSTETVLWNAEGKVVWRGRAEWAPRIPVQPPQGGRALGGGNASKPVRTPGAPRRPLAGPVKPVVGALAWNGADVAVSHEDWKKGDEIEVFTWALAGFGTELAHREGKAVWTAGGTDSGADWWVVRWNDWPDAPGVLRFHAFAVKEDNDGDGLDDGREVMEWRTRPSRCDSDGDTRGDGLEIFLGSDPLLADLEAGLTVNALWADPAGAGGSWVELHSSLPREIALEGLRLETAREGQWRTACVFPGGLSMPPGSTLLIGESGVANADLHAGLDFPVRWPAQPEAGVRLVWDGAACGCVADAVVVGRGKLPERGGLDREGWDGDAGVRADGAKPIVRHAPGTDSNLAGDWTTRAGYAGHSLKDGSLDGGTGERHADGNPGR